MAPRLAEGRAVLSGPTNIEDSFLLAAEIAANPPRPDVNSIQQYAKDVGGVTHWFSQDHAGNVADMTQMPGALWTPWVPTIAAQTGLITSTTITVARYIQLGKIVVMMFDFTVTNAGTGSGGFTISLPVAAAGAAGNCALGGARESNVVGYSLVAILNTSSLLFLDKYDATNAVVNGHRPVGGAVYEAA